MTEESRDNYDNDLIDLTIILDILKNRFKFIIALTIFAASISVYYSLSLPNIYQSTAILSSSSIAKNSNRGIPSFSQLANFSSGSSNELDVMKGVEIIRSYDFFERLTQNNDIFFELMASKGWDASKNEFIIDPEEYNLEKQTWVSTKRFSKNGMPSMQTAHREFRSMLSIVLEKESGFVKISIQSYSPQFAKELLDIVIHEINELSRTKVITQSKRAIEFLEKEASESNINEVKTGISNLIEEHIEKITLANVTPEYLFTLLSPPIVPERKVSPSRALICILGTLLGLILAIIVAFLMELRIKNISNNAVELKS